METQANTVYDAIYFQDEYSAEYAKLRARYRCRMTEAINGRHIDKDPVPNATTVVHLGEGSDGEIKILTTGDFVEFFEQKYGNADRMGAVRKSLELATVQAKNRKEMSTERREAITHSAEKGFFGRVRTVKRNFFLPHALFTLLLLAAMAMLIISSSMLKTANETLAALEHESALLSKEETIEETTEGVLGYRVEEVGELSMSGESTVEIYETEGGKIEMSAMLNALFGRK